MLESAMSAVDSVQFRKAKEDFDGLKQLNTSNVSDGRGSQVLDSAMTLNASEVNPFQKENRAQAFDAIKELSASKQSQSDNSMIQCEYSIEMVSRIAPKKAIPVEKKSVEV